MHILIVTHFFPPLNEIGSLRPYYFAKYWAEEGHEVTVVTTKKYSSYGILDLNKQYHTGIKVIEVDFPSRFFWFSHTNTQPAATPQPLKVKSKGLIQRIKSMGRNILNQFGTLLDPLDTWVKPASEACLAIVKKQPVDLLVTSFSPSAVNKIGAIIKKQHPEIKWIADYRDLWSQNHISRAKGLLNFVERSIEHKTVGKYADMLTVVSAPLKEDLSKLLKQPVKVITNGFDPEDTSRIQAAEKLTPSKINIVYTGTIYSGRRDPSPLFQALNMLYEDGLLSTDDVKVLFYGKFQGDLQEIIDRNHANKWVEVRGHITYNDSISIQKGADILLFLESAAPEARGVLTGKLFEYLVSGVPVLGIGIDQQVSSGQLILETKTGWVCGKDVEAIKQVILSILHKQYHYNPDMAIINRYTRQQTAKDLLAAAIKLDQ